MVHVYTGKAAATSSSSSRFSKFTGGGDVAFVMGAIPNIHIPEAEQITIVVRSGTATSGPMAVDVEWCRNCDEESEGYQCLVASPKKESKLKGLKSFIAYQITPTVSYYVIK